MLTCMCSSKSVKCVIAVNLLCVCVTLYERLCFLIVANWSRECTVDEASAVQDRVQPSQHAALYCMQRDLFDADVHIPYPVVSICYLFIDFELFMAAA